MRLFLILLRAWLVAFLLCGPASASQLLNSYKFASTGNQSLIATLTSLGLTTNLKLALDAGDGNSYGYTSADPYFSDVALLLHCEGSDASTTFTDSSPNGFTISHGGDAQIDTAQFKYGSASCLFDGTGDSTYLTGGTPNVFGTGDFTIEVDIRLNATGTTQVIDDSRESDGSLTAPVLYINSSNHLVFAAGGSTLITGTATLTTGTWYHVAVSRSGTSTKLFLDGSQDGSTASDSNDYTIGTSRPLFGIGYDGSSSPLNGWLDEIRITKGVARYTTTFTPPSAVFPDGTGPGTAKWFDTSGNGYDFLKGDGATSTTYPTFNGITGGLSSSEYWSFDGGDWFTYDTTNETWMTNLHKDNATFSFIAWVYVGSYAADQRLFGDMDYAATTGVNISLKTGQTVEYWVNGPSGGVLSDTTGTLGSTGIWQFIAGSLDESVGTNGVITIIDGTQSLADSTYSSPGTGNATSTFHLFSTGSGFTPISNGSRVAMFGMWSTALTRAQMVNIYAATKGRFN